MPESDARMAYAILESVEPCGEGIRAGSWQTVRFRSGHFLRGLCVPRASYQSQVSEATGTS
jgi:hypothetical protein